MATVTGFRRKKLTYDEKLCREILKQYGRQLTREMRSRATRGKTGALRASISSKVVSRKNRVTLIVGVRARYERKKHIPQKYAKKQNLRTRFISGTLSASDVASLQAKVAKELTWK